MINRRTHERGLIKMIIVILVILLILAYFGLNLRAIVGSPTFQDNWQFLKGTAANLWINYLRAPVVYVWDNIFVPLIWKPAVNNVMNAANNSGLAATSSTTTLPFTH